MSDFEKMNYLAGVFVDISSRKDDNIISLTKIFLHFKDVRWNQISEFIKWANMAVWKKIIMDLTRFWENNFDKSIFNMFEYNYLLISLLIQKNS